MGYPITLSQDVQPLVFLMVLASDNRTGATGLTPTVNISKNGGAFAPPAGAVSELGYGWYAVAANSADADTLGPLILHAEAAGADQTDELYPVVAYNMESSTNLGLSDMIQVDPWAFALPGSYVAGQAGYIVGNLLPNMQITVLSPVSVHCNVDVFFGNDYLTIDGRALPWKSSGIWPTNLAGAKITLNIFANRLSNISLFSAPGQVISPTGTQIVTVQLSNGQIAQIFGLSQAGVIAANVWWYQLNCQLPDGSNVTIAHGNFRIFPS